MDQIVWIIIALVCIAAAVLFCILWLTEKKKTMKAAEEYREQEKKLRKIEGRCAKFRKFYSTFNKWMNLEIGGRSYVRYLQYNHYERILIYGAKEMGILLYDELRKNGVEVAGIIDRYADYMSPDVDTVLYMPGDELPEADLMVVTAVSSYEEIKKDMEGRVQCPILSLVELLNMG